MTDLKDLQEKIKAAQDSKIPPPENTSKVSEGLNTGMRILTELIGTIGISGLIGYLLDRWLDTAPIFIMIFLLLGIITVFYNMTKFLRGYGQNIGYTDLQNETKNVTPSADKTDNNINEQ